MIACARVFLIVMGMVALLSSSVFAAGPKTYQVTGDLKVGSKVTIEYTMKAATIEVKDTGKTAKPKKTESAPAKK